MTAETLLLVYYYYLRVLVFKQVFAATTEMLHLEVKHPVISNYFRALCQRENIRAPQVNQGTFIGNDIEE